MNELDKLVKRIQRDVVITEIAAVIAILAAVISGILTLWGNP